MNILAIGKIFFSKVRKVQLKIEITFLQQTLSSFQTWLTIDYLSVILETEVWGLRAWPNDMRIHSWEADIEEKRLGTNYHTNPQSAVNSLLWKNILLLHVKICQACYYVHCKSLILAFKCGPTVLGISHWQNLWYSPVNPHTSNVSLRGACRHLSCTMDLWVDLSPVCSWKLRAILDQGWVNISLFHVLSSTFMLLGS